MTSLQQQVNSDLAVPDPRESQRRVKKTVANALEQFDPSATLTVTDYFNHTYAPDMVLRWGRVERPVFLRFTDNVPELGRDIDLLDRLDPLMFGLSTPRAAEARANRLDQRARDADILLATATAVESLNERTKARTSRMLRNSLAHGGRGALLARKDTQRLAESLETGVDAAGNGQVSETRRALTTISEFFDAEQAQRLNRVVQAVWEGGGARIDQFPGEPELTTKVGDASLAYLVEYMDTTELAFWRTVGRELTLAQIIALADAGHAGRSNFQHLINANLNTLRARACAVLDMALVDENEPPPLRWEVSEHVNEDATAVALRGPNFHAFLTSSKDDLQPRHLPTHRGIAVSDFVRRTRDAVVQIINVNVTQGGKHIQLSDDSGATDTAFLQATTKGLAGAEVDRATVTTPSGRVLIDFSHGTGVGMNRTENLAADLLLTSVGLLNPLPEPHRSDLTTFLTVTDRADEPGESDAIELPFDDLHDSRGGDASTEEGPSDDPE